MLIARVKQYAIIMIFPVKGLVVSFLEQCGTFLSCSKPYADYVNCVVSADMDSGTASFWPDTNTSGRLPQLALTVVYGPGVDVR